jgi:hypothetical protein
MKQLSLQDNTQEDTIHHLFLKLLDLLDNNNVTNRDIVHRRQEGGLLTINETHPAYDALSYPIFFPQGRHG